MSSPTANHRIESAGRLSRFPVVGWASLGAASVLLIVWVLAKWVLGGVSSIDPGPDPMSPMKLCLLHGLEWGQFAVFLVILYRFVARPLFRREPLGFDGLFVLGAILLNFWDPLDNYWLFSFQYNAHHLNVESWGGYIPGWHSQHAELWAVPVAFVFGAYTWAFFLAVRMGCAILERLQRTRPSWGPLRGFGAVFLASAALSAVAELVYLRIGAIANVHPANQLTLWNQQPYGWPLYNPVFFGLTWTAMTALRWSRNDDGLSFVERGAQVVQSTRGQAIVRFLATFAFMEVAYIGLYFLPWNAMAFLRDIPPPHLPTYFPVP